MYCKLSWNDPVMILIEKHFYNDTIITSNRNRQPNFLKIIFKKVKLFITKFEKALQYLYSKNKKMNANRNVKIHYKN